jgi:hypothetical protein
LRNTHTIEAIYKNSTQPIAELFGVIDFLHAANEKAKKAWHDIDHILAARAAVGIGRATRDSHVINITSFAVIMDMPRTTALRLVKEWEKQGYFELEVTAKNTFVYGTQKMIDASVQYFDELAELKAEFNTVQNG